MWSQNNNYFCKKITFSISRAEPVQRTCVCAYAFKFSNSRVYVYRRDHIVHPFFQWPSAGLVKSNTVIWQLVHNELIRIE